MSEWQCGDCGCRWSHKITACPHKLDDYLRTKDGGTIELTMAKRIAPIMRKFDVAADRINPPFMVTTFDWYGHEAVTITPSKHGGYDFRIPLAG